MSISKKQVLTLGLLTIGGIGVATMVNAAGGSAEGQGASMEGLRQGRAGQVLGSQQGYSNEAPSIFKVPAETFTGFPEQRDYSDFLSQFLSPKESGTGTQGIGRGTQGVSSPGKKQVIYGGYKPSGKSYVFGGRAFESQTASEVVSQGYSPTLSEAFGILPEITREVGTVISTPKNFSSEKSSSKKVSVSSGRVTTSAESRAGMRSFRKKLGMPAHGRSD